MIDSIARALMRPEKASLEPQKAVTGPGAAVMSWGIPLSSAQRNEQQMMKDAQTVYARGNRWVRRAEMVISNRVGGVKWHLETDDGETITDESSEELRKIRDLIEKPLGGQDFAKAYPQQPSTRRESWGVTSRHMGLCNVGFWMLDEIDKAIGWPQRIFMIRPDRMTPREEDGRLAGWTLDADAHGGGTDLSLDEVLPFYLDQPDKGYFGTGLVESVLGTLGLPSAIDRHALDTLSSGGRLPGIYSPKESTGDDVFDRLMTDLRVIKEMPDSSKRDVVARAPINFTPTASDMSSLVVTALATMSRDDTLTHWGVPLATIGGQAPTGMNSGGSRDYDEAALWQNAVGFRIVALRETLQFQFLDRLQAIGINVQLVIEEPTFDDDSPKYELAAKAAGLPLTNKERRALVGLDPFGIEALDNAIVMPMHLVEYGTSVQSRPADDVPLEGVQADTEVGKATLEIKGLRGSIDRLMPKMQKDVQRFLDSQKSDLAKRVGSLAGHLSKKPTDSVWWHADKWDKELRKVLAPYASEIANLTAERTQASLGTGKAEPFGDLAGNRVLQRLLDRLGTRITGINETTREKVARAIKDGVEAGDGAAALGTRIQELTGFNEYRAELIARTESARVLNESQIESFREFGVQKVRAIDGDEDPECAARDGQTFPLDEAMEIADHPNGTLDWVPIV